MSRFGGIFDFEVKCERLEEVERELADPTVWEDQDEASRLGKERAGLEQIVATLSELHGNLDEYAELAELAAEENDGEALDEIDHEALLAPYFLSVLARAGAKKDDYVGDPRGYNEALEGWRKRANFAQLNAFESFPGFAASVIVAHLAAAPQGRIDLIAILFVFFRVLHAIFYITDKPSLRSYSWQFSILCVIALFVVAAL